MQQLYAHNLLAKAVDILQDSERFEHDPEIINAASRRAQVYVNIAKAMKSDNPTRIIQVKEFR